MHDWHIFPQAHFKILALKLSLNKVLLLVLLVTAIKIFFIFNFCFTLEFHSVSLLLF